MKTLSFTSFILFVSLSAFARDPWPSQKACEAIKEKDYLSACKTVHSSGKDSEVSCKFSVRGVSYLRQSRPNFPNALTDLEVASINVYTGNSYAAVNKYLRRDKIKYPKNEMFELFVRIMRCGLAKLPVYEGTVKRFVMSPPPGFKEEHAPGNQVEYGAFTSSSMNSWWYGQLLIHSHHGRIIESLSDHPSEKEVLFDAGTCFRVIGEISEGYELEEEDCDEDRT